MEMNENAAQPPKGPQLPAKTIRNLIIGAVILIVAVTVGSSSFYTVQEQERAAVLTFGKFTEERGAGLHFKWPAPIQEVLILPAELIQTINIGYSQQGDQSISNEDEALMITGDENIVSADAVIQWKINDLNLYLFNVDKPERFLRNAANASIRSVIGSVKLDYAITDGKTVIQEKVREHLVDLQEKYQTGIQIVAVKFQDIEPPAGEVEEAFRAVTNAREEKNTKINVAQKYEFDRIPKARGEAQAMLDRASGVKESRIQNALGDIAQFNALHSEYVKNPATTEKRLILETLENILPNAQIFITNSNSDTVNYLPLNDLLKNNNKAGNSSSTSNNSSPAVTEGAQGGNSQ